MQFCDRLLLENRAWADEMRARDPDFFARLNHRQSPQALWIGCSDSRVPPEQLCNAAPADLLIHRNVANLAARDDTAS
ncbi:carbonate dehydratase [Salinisphaera sp. T31B1]